MVVLEESSLGLRFSNKYLADLTLIRKNICATLLHEKGPRGPRKGNAQLTRQNDFSFI